MSTTIKSVVFLGTRISRDFLYKKVKRKKFEHNFPSDYEFDPKTGFKLWETYLDPVDDYDIEREQYKGLDVSYRGENDYYIGLKMREIQTYPYRYEEGEDRSINISDINIKFEHLKKKFKEYNIEGTVQLHLLPELF